MVIGSRLRRDDNEMVGISLHAISAKLVPTKAESRNQEKTPIFLVILNFQYSIDNHQSSSSLFMS
jgi:hypothetical protein